MKYFLLKILRLFKRKNKVELKDKNDVTGFKRL